MKEIDICVQTAPPISAPVPMPKLNIPENIDIATEVCAGGVPEMISDCMDTLKAVADIPRSTQRTMTAGALNESGPSASTLWLSGTILTATIEMIDQKIEWAQATPILDAISIPKDVEQ